MPARIRQYCRTEERLAFRPDEVRGLSIAAVAARHADKMISPPTEPAGIHSQTTHASCGKASQYFGRNSATNVPTFSPADTAIA